MTATWAVAAPAALSTQTKYLHAVILAAFHIWRDLKHQGQPVDEAVLWAMTHWAVADMVARESGLGGKWMTYDAFWDFRNATRRVRKRAVFLEHTTAYDASLKGDLP